MQLFASPDEIYRKAILRNKRQNVLIETGRKCYDDALWKRIIFDIIRKINN